MSENKSAISKSSDSTQKSKKKTFKVKLKSKTKTPTARTTTKTKTKTKTPTARTTTKTKTKTKTKTPTARTTAKTKSKTQPEKIDFTKKSKPLKTQLSAISEKTENSFSPIENSLPIKSNCSQLYESLKDNIGNLNISDKEYQDLLKCVEQDNHAMFSDDELEDIDSLYPHLDDGDFNVKLSIKKEFDEVKIKEKTREQIENIEKVLNKYSLIL